MHPSSLVPRLFHLHPRNEAVPHLHPGNEAVPHLPHGNETTYMIMHFQLTMVEWGYDGSYMTGYVQSYIHWYMYLYTNMRLRHKTAKLSKRTNAVTW